MLDNANADAKIRTTTQTQEKGYWKGWKPIDVFFGDSNNNHIGSSGRSQCGQDNVVMACVFGCVIAGQVVVVVTHVVKCQTLSFQRSKIKF